MCPFHIGYAFLGSQKNCSINFRGLHITKATTKTILQNQITKEKLFN